LGAPESLVQSLAGPEPLMAALSDSDRALVRYAIRLTRQPSGIGAEDVEELRKHRFSDSAIHDACQVIAYFNYVNRVADGLGVELENGEAR
jgi:uncharacterized peroxidase-related enzyme